MNTMLSRLNALFAFTLSVTASLTFLLFLTTLTDSYQSDVVTNAVKTHVRKLVNYEGDGRETDLGFVTFDLDADLTHLFNWNNKQLFVYVTAEYATSPYAVNQVVLWDKIIKRRENPTQLNFRSASPEYYFWDEGTGLKGNDNITMTVSWNVIPNAGRLINVKSARTHQFAFPAQYTKSKL